MLIKSYGSAVLGVESFRITVEINVDRGVNFQLVGLPDNAIRESQFRIAAALKNIGYRWPGFAITVNLAPADMRKEGSAYDLAIALGILAASEQIECQNFEDYILVGELSLDGGLQNARGVLPVAVQAKKEGYRGLILPKQNANEAALVEGLEVIGVKNLAEVVEFFENKREIKPTKIDISAEFAEAYKNPVFDFLEVKGQGPIKRALEIAAAGGHNVILIGPPGAGKTMLAKRLPTILPPLTLEEALETTKVHSVAGHLRAEGLVAARPFRAPHHSVSDVALVGGGSHPQPGEISLAHNGILFLDELPEFKRQVLEVLRQPMEERSVVISRARFTVRYPSSFMLVASMNPCPCGYHNHPDKDCVCPPGLVQRYLSRISGPLMDRIDLHVEVTPVDFEEMASKRKEESSGDIRERVLQARKIQQARFADQSGVYCNAQMNHRQLRQVCTLEPEGLQLLKTAMDRLKLSARAYDRILKLARTIADLEGMKAIQTQHLAEAVQYRSLDRESWSG